MPDKITKIRIDDHIEKIREAAYNWADKIYVPDKNTQATNAVVCACASSLSTVPKDSILFLREKGILTV